ncbi:MAG: bifunctional oligoribonuclease/PAP phosphatase NrnA [Acidaminococcales bacterium]|jgi:phosphoesterase RecJ-like protein|nr:bifunctional oligoribonuclease/PAP phosphatase NrnA [Acidaminococcales bacterium]
MKECSLRETADILLKADKIALTTHINSDGDALGSLLGLGAALERLGKEVYFLIDDVLPTQYMFLPGIEKIKRPDEFLTIKADLLVILDASDFERIGKVADFTKAAFTLNIDHHISNSGLSDFRLLDVAAAATCEIIFCLLAEMGVAIDRQIAVALYAGVVSDCGFFRYANTTAKTLRVAAQLLDVGVVPNEIADFIETKTVENLYLLPKILDTLRFFLDGKIAAIIVPISLYHNNIDSDAFIRYPRYVSGVEVALLFKEISENITRVSIRSKTLDVSKVALEFGGGGHMRASGCTLRADIVSAQQIMVDVLRRYMEEPC